jgi:hypothetical protein
MIMNDRLKYIRLKVEINQELVQTRRLLQKVVSSESSTEEAELRGRLQILQQLDGLVQLLDSSDSF